MTEDEINDAVIDEGWGLFECSGSAHGPLQIQKVDEEDTFADDTDAWEHVWTRAQAGSPPHIAALQLVAIENPQEFSRIVDWVTGAPERNVLDSDGDQKGTP